MANSKGSTAGPIRDRESDRELVFKAVHELRESLRTIRAGSELLATKYGAIGEEASNNLVGMVVGGVDRMETLINDVAEYCYVESADLRRAKADIDAVVHEARAQLADEIRSAGAIISQDALPCVTGDFGALTTLFRVLIENCCKFRSEDPPRIHIGVENHGTCPVFSVRDNGVGFSAAYKDLVFQPFEKLNGRQYPGSGLGLFIARRIVEQHQGAIWAESELGEGCTLRFQLWVSDDDEGV